MSHNKLKHIIFKLVLILMGLYVFLPFNFKNGITILAFAGALIFIRESLKSVSIIDILVFLLIGIAPFFTQLNSASLNELIRLSPLIIFPLFFSSFKYESHEKLKKEMILFNKIFFVSLNLFFIFFIYYFTSLGYKGVKFFFNFPEMTNSGIGSFSFHPIYLSILTCLSIVIGVELLNREKSIFKRTLLFLGICFLTFNTVCLSRKAFLFFILGCVP